MNTYYSRNFVNFANSLYFLVKPHSQENGERYVLQDVAMKKLKTQLKKIFNVMVSVVER